MKAHAVFLLAVIVFFAPAVAEKAYFTPADILQSWAPFRTPGSRASPGNPLLSDIVTQIDPWLKFSREQLREGSFPLWNPYAGAGAPHFANLQSAVLFPLTSLYYFLSWRAALLLAPFLKLFLIASFTYLYLRSIGLGAAAAAFGALNFAFIGFNTFWLVWPLSNLMIFLPLVLFLAEKFAVERAGIRYPLLLSISVGLAGAAGHIETLFHILLIASVYLIWRVRSLEPASRRPGRILLFLLFAALGVGIASLQLVPFLEYMFLSAAYAKRTTYAGSPYWQPLPAAILNLIPDFYGNPSRHDYFAPFTNYCMSVGGFAGATSVLLASLAFFSPARKLRHARFYLVMPVLSFCLVYRIEPIYRLLTRLPLLDVADNSRLLFCIGFSVSVLAALLVQSLGEASENSPRAAAIVSVTLTIVAIAAFLAFANKAFFEAHGFRFRFRHNLTPTLLFLVYTGLGSCLLLLRRFRKIGSGYCTFSLGALVFAQTAVHAMGFNTFVEKKLFYPVPPSIRFLWSDASVHRCLFVGNVFFPNLGTWYGIQDPRNYDAMNVRSYRAFQEAMGDFEGLFQVVTRANENMASFLNVKYVICPEKVAAGFMKKVPHPKNYRLAYSDDSVRVYENLACLPRAYLVSRVRLADSDKEVLKGLPAADLRRECLLTDRAVPRFAASRLANSSCTITSYRPRRVELSIDAEAPCYLVLSDNYFPGWRAFINGEEQKIYRANGSFRLVAVPRTGRHRVTFIYDPLSFKVGIALSLICAAAALALSLVLFPVTSACERGTRPSSARSHDLRGG